MSTMHSSFHNRAPMTGPVGSPPKPSVKEEQLQFVVHELGHRIKNLLAVVQALANQTAQRSATVEEFRTVFSERLQGLSRSLDLLVQEDGRGATIADLVRSQLGPFGGKAAKLDDFHRLADEAALERPGGQMRDRSHLRPALRAE